MRVGSVVRISANGNIARGTQGGLSGEVRGHTEESDDSIPVGNTELASHSRTAFLQSEVYTAATVLDRTKTQGIRPTSRTSESTYRISYDLGPVGLGTRLTRNSEPAGQWWALPTYLVWPLVQPTKAMNQSLVLRMIKVQLEVNNV